MTALQLPAPGRYLVELDGKPRVLRVVDGTDPELGYLERVMVEVRPTGRRRDWWPVGTVTVGSRGDAPVVTCQHATSRAIVTALCGCDQARARERYAEVEHRCSRCGRELKADESVTRGLGPDCARKEGVA